MRRLIVSDIHANIDALEAVLADAAGSYDEIFCAGDLVGYSANPAEVIDWARAAGGPRLIVRGNHDRACCGVSATGDFNKCALEAILWTRAELDDDRRAWLARLTAGPLAGDGFSLAHGSPADEDDYLTHSCEVEAAEDQFIHPVSLIGHTHIQGGWSFERGGILPISRPGSSERERVIDLHPDYFYVINPGSVGQPRDRDPRAAYALWDSDEHLLRFRRVRYDIRSAQSRIYEAGLPPFLAERLAVGR